jgi:hypothetical protein
METAASFEVRNAPLSYPTRVWPEAMLCPGPHREGEERAARLAAILVGESPTSIGVQSML